MRGRPNSQQEGMSLVEVLVALVLLAVALLPVVVGFSQALVSTSDASIAAVAASIAREKMEEMKSIDFDLLDSQPRAPRDLRAGDAFFEVTSEVELHTSVPDLKKVAVVVYRNGSARPIATVTTYVARAGV